MFRKRLFVALTVIVMVISMVGVTAFAESDTYTLHFSVFSNSNSSPFVSFSEDFDGDDLYGAVTFRDFFEFFAEYCFDAIPEDFDSSSAPYCSVKIQDNNSGRTFFAYGQFEEGFVYSGTASPEDLVSHNLNFDCYFYDSPHLSLRPSFEEFTASGSSVPPSPSEPSDNFHQDLSSIVTPATMTHVLDEVVGLLPIVLPVLILFIGLRKGISWLMNFLQSA